MKPAVVALTLAACLVGLQAQEPEAAPAFDVVSVKRNVSGEDLAGIGTPTGRFFTRNWPLASLIRFAFDLPPGRIQGIPPWASTERYDIEATIPAGVPASFLRPMLQPCSVICSVS